MRLSENRRLRMTISALDRSLSQYRPGTDAGRISRQTADNRHILV